MKQYISRLYRSIRLNLGIKRALESVSKHIVVARWQLKSIVDTNFFYPIYMKMAAYFYRSEVYHYGADYRWNDQESQNLDTLHINQGYGLMHYAFVRNVRPKRILCVGSMYGYIPYMLAKACMENGMGHVDFVDAAFDYNNVVYKNSHYFGQGFWKQVDSQKHFSYILNSSYITTYVQTLEDFIGSHSGSYEYVYLDGDHSYDGLVRDIRLIWPRLIKGGLLSLHDIEFNFKKSLHRIPLSMKRKVEHVTFGVARIWEAFEKTNQTLPIYNHYSGLGFIYKKETNTSLPDFLKNDAI